jgi:hypothetical protein
LLLHLPLLGGLVLIGLPVLLHLLMRQKPKHLLFPAFRFLQQKAKTNQRKIRLRHLLLLLLRILLIALLCFALASLRGRNQVGAVVLVVDTSPSMEYTAGGKTRLDDAKTRALEVLNSIAPDSKVAVLDPGDPLQQWGSVEEARDRVNRLAIRPGAQPLTSTLAGAYRLFAEYQGPGGDGGTAVQRHLYVFSDRTINSWEPGRTPDLQAQQERLGEPAINSVYVDLGVEKPVDVAITNLEVTPASVPANQRVVVRATITATGQACDTEVICKIVGEATAERKPVKLQPGQSEVLEFINRELSLGKDGATRQYQAEVTLATADALPVSNARFVTFEVRGARKVFAVSDERSYARFFQVALDAKGDFKCEVKTPDEVPTVQQLKDATAVCLLSVAKPTKELWAALTEYVSEGGHLLVVPGRDETRPETYRTDEAQKLLPGIMRDAVVAPRDKPARWAPLKRTHVLLAKFVTWKEQEDVGFLKHNREAYRYWRVEAPGENSIVNYAVPDGHPALLERLAGRPRGSGRVLMLTTPIDFRPDLGPENDWNDYAKTTINDGFFVVLANELFGYMAGDLDEPAFNFNSGQVVTLPLPPSARFAEYTLDAPGVTGAETRLVRGDADAELAIRQTNFAGNARVTGGNPAAPWHAAFSLNPPGVEFNLDRLPTEEIDKLFGPDSVVAPGQNRPLAEALGARGRRPIDMFPWLMLALVALLIAESIVANRFYKPEANEPVTTS